MFTSSAELYDLIYSEFKDYPAEAAEIAALIRGLHPGARTVLDVACGTGEHAKLLAEKHGFIVDGLDLDPSFVRIAQGKLGSGSVYQADMTSFDLARKYDVILCMFSSIGYVRTLENVERAIRCFRNHLNDGGSILVEPWFGPDFIEHGRVSVNTAQSDTVKVARMSRLEVDGRLSRIHFEYLIGRRDGIEHAVEVHELGLFTTDEMAECFQRAGIKVKHETKGPSGRGLFIATA